MRLVCLECSAAYEAPDSLFGPQPREVRCNRCGYQWTVIGSQPGDDAAAAGLSVGAGAPPPAPSLKLEPVGAPPPPRSSRLMDRPAGVVTSGQTAPGREPPRPAPVMEPAAESTRMLLADDAMGNDRLAPPDLEERRLSHDLDFDAAERRRREFNTHSQGGGTRRLVILIILVLVAIGVVAAVFEDGIVAAIPALKPLYAQVGL